MSSVAGWNALYKHRADTIESSCPRRKDAGPGIFAPDSGSGSSSAHSSWVVLFQHLYNTLAKNARRCDRFQQVNSPENGGKREARVYTTPSSPFVRNAATPYVFSTAIGWEQVSGSDPATGGKRRTSRSNNLGPSASLLPHTLFDKMTSCSTSPNTLSSISFTSP